VISLPVPAGLPLDSASWEQTLLMMRQVIVQRLAVIQQQTVRIAALEARLSQHSRNADRPPSAAPPFVTKPSSSTHTEDSRSEAGTSWTSPSTVGAYGGHRSDARRLWLWTAGVPRTEAYYTHQVIELPAIQMAVTHVVWHETRCPRCGRLLKAELPPAYCYGYGPRLTALIGELSGGQRDSCTAVQECCASVLGVPMSLSAIQRKGGCKSLGRDLSLRPQGIDHRDCTAGVWLEPRHKIEGDTLPVIHLTTPTQAC
jgi:transposase